MAGCGAGEVSDEPRHQRGLSPPRGYCRGPLGVPSRATGQAGEEPTAQAPLRPPSRWRGPIAMEAGDERQGARPEGGAGCPVWPCP